MLNKYSFWQHHKNADATVSLLLRSGGLYQKKLKYRLATSLDMQEVVVAKVISGIQTW